MRWEPRFNETELFAVIVVTITLALLGWGYAMSIVGRVVYKAHLKMKEVSKDIEVKPLLSRLTGE